MDQISYQVYVHVRYIPFLFFSLNLRWYKLSMCVCVGGGGGMCMCVCLWMYVVLCYCLRAHAVCLLR